MRVVCVWHLVIACLLSVVFQCICVDVACLCRSQPLKQVFSLRFSCLSVGGVFRLFRFSLFALHVFDVFRLPTIHGLCAWSTFCIICGGGLIKDGRETVCGADTLVSFFLV